MLSLQFDKPYRFSLDVSGMAGWLGGDDAMSAMTVLHIYGNSRWLGWYNTPGSFQLAKRLGMLTNSASFHRSSTRSFVPNGLSSCVYADPMTLFELDTCKRPTFHAAHSETIIRETGYFCALFMKVCTDLEGRMVSGRWTQPVGITISDLGHDPASELHPVHHGILIRLSAIIPITVSVGACMLCAAYRDWYASSSILIGILASGISCLVLGSAALLFTHPESANGSSTSGGILTSDKGIVLLKGTENAVQSIIHGRISLRFSNEGHFNLVQSCSVLFFIQCIAQLFLVPQASLFGHAMFFTSLGVSALYNAWFSSLDKGKIQKQFLLETVLGSPTLTKYTLGTRTAAAVFTLLVLQPQDPARLLNEFLPDETMVWRRCKATVLEQLHDRGDRSFLFECRVGDLDGLTTQQQDLLRLLYDDVRAAYNAYRDYIQIDSL